MTKDPRFYTLAGGRKHREEIRAIRSGRYLIVQAKPTTMAYSMNIRFALVPEDERADYEAGGAHFVDYDTPPPKVSVVSAADAGLDPSSKWYCSCDRHNRLLGTSSKRLAQSAAREPQEWCDGCREEVAA